MKFTDGLWNKLNGVVFNGAVGIREVLTATDEEVEFVAGVKPYTGRGDSLNTPLITVKVDSPMDDVIHVQIDHFTGGADKGPHFELFPDGKPSSPKLKLSKGDDTLTFSSGSLSMELQTAENTFGVRFTDSANTNHSDLCFIEPKGVAFVDVPYHNTISSLSQNGILSTKGDALTNDDPSKSIQHLSGGSVRYVLNEMSLQVDEKIFGLGERFGPLIKNGQVVDTWNGDGGTSSEISYKSVPFYLSSRGYGVWVDHSEEVSFEVGREKCSSLGISARGERLSYYVIGGGSMKAALMNYVKMTGRPALPPAWSWGLYLSTSFTTNYDEKTVTSFLQGMKDRGCPVRVFHFDCFWLRKYCWTDFVWDPVAFPDPKGYLTKIKKEFNIKTCAWINPYMGQRGDTFKEGKEKGYFIKRTNGDVWQWDMWQPGMAIVDFTNPEAYQWYSDLVAKLIDTGIDTIKTDFGELIPYVGVKYHDGSDPLKMHNYYAFLYNKCVFQTIEKKLGKGQAAVFARSATSGGQRFPVHWGGDCASTWEGMAEALRGALSLSTSGFGYVSHDIAGFEGTPPLAVYARWVGFGLFSSHSRLHGSGSYRVPWLYGEEAVQATAKMTKAKLRLMPYHFAQAIKTHETGLPTMRSMALEFPDDPTCAYLDRQYMLGDSLLVAPVFHESKAQFYLPEGVWTDFWSGEKVTGPKWIKKEYSLVDMPVYVRPNSVLLLGPEDVVVPDYPYDTTELEVRSYELSGDVSVDVPTVDGKWAGKITVKKDGSFEAGKFKLVKSKLI